MKNTDNTYLVLAGCCSFSIAILHIAIIIGGGDWYRFFGAGEKMAVMAENGSLYPIVITMAIILTFSIFGLYAFSGAGLISRLPFTKAVLFFISCGYLTRGIGGIPIILFVEHPYLNEINTRIGFIFVSSLLSLIIGVFYGIGTLTNWSSSANNKNI
jgi:putative oxidoreductase